MKEEKLIVDTLLAQWVKLSDRIENIENGHWQVFTLVIATFGLFSLNNSSSTHSIGTVYWIMPIIITVVITYEAYRLREQAILRRYLSKIETTINGYLEVKDYKCNNYDSLDHAIEWYSKYKIHYSSSEDALAKRLVLIPIGIAIVFIYVVLLLQILQHWPTLQSICLLLMSGFTLIFDCVMIADIKNSEKLKIESAEVNEKAVVEK